MKETLIDLAIYFVLLGGFCACAVAIVSLINMIYRLYANHRDRRLQAESRAAIATYRKVTSLLGEEMTEQEFHRALRRTVRRNHLGDSNGVIEFAGSDLDYLAGMIAETVRHEH